MQTRVHVNLIITSCHRDYALSLHDALPICGLKAEMKLLRADWAKKLRAKAAARRCLPWLAVGDRTGSRRWSSHWTDLYAFSSQYACRGGCVSRGTVESPALSLSNRSAAEPK